jgi:hypothetical protein
MDECAICQAEIREVADFGPTFLPSFDQPRSPTFPDIRPQLKLYLCSGCNVLTLEGCADNLRIVHKFVFSNKHTIR